MKSYVWLAVCQRLKQLSHPYDLSASLADRELLTFSSSCDSSWVVIVVTSRKRMSMCIICKSPTSQSQQPLLTLRTRLTLHNPHQTMRQRGSPHHCSNAGWKRLSVHYSPSAPSSAHSSMSACSAERRKMSCSSSSPSGRRSRMALRDDQHDIPECVTGMIVPFPTDCPILQT
jgi:hypothetical protein